MPAVLSTSDVAAAPLYPPAVTPPKAPLPLLPFLATFVRNPLAALPESVYREPLTSYSARGGTIAWVSAPDLVRQVLLERAQSFPKTALEQRVLGPLLGRGILTSEGADWRWQRQVVAPLFRQQELAAYVPAMTAAADALVARWHAHSNPLRRIDLDMTDVTFEVISATILPSDGEVRRAIGHANESYLGHISWPIAYAMLRLPDWLPHPGRGSMNRAESDMRAAVTALVRKRKASGEMRVDLLDRLLAARDAEGRPMPEQQLVDNLITFLAAGHATTAMALTWTLYLLARAPAWAHAARHEIDEVCSSGPIGIEQIERLPVTTRIIKEAMRLYPPVPVMTRVAGEDLELGGHGLKKNTLIVVPIWAIHRHHALWDDPARFDPDRFLPEAEAARPRYHYLPFGAGPRICIGMSFAMVEATVLAATFLRAADFHVTPGPEPVPLSRVTLHPRDGLTMVVRPRTQRRKAA